MRLSFFAAVLFQFCMPLVVSADCHSTHKVGCHTGCHAVPQPASCCAPVAPCSCGHAVVPVAPSCSSCGCGPVCPKYDYANFNQQFYAEFYARNPWYLEAKKKEAAEKRKAYETARR